MLMADEAQFIQNFLTVIGLLFSILAGNAYALHRCTPGLPPPPRKPTTHLPLCLHLPLPFTSPYACTLHLPTPCRAIKPSPPHSRYAALYEQQEAIYFALFQVTLHSALYTLYALYPTI